MNKISSHHLPIEFKARYYTLGNFAEAQPCWLVLHGYGQLAQYFIRKFTYLESLGHSVIAPEGLSRFYLNGFSGRVGATWMTKEDRLTDIENYKTYLSTLVNKMVPEGSPLYIVGFSQGAATASRFMTNCPKEIAGYVQWAGKFPPDVSPEKDIPALRGKIIRMVYGEDDSFITPDDIAEQTSLLQKISSDFRCLSFKGEHTVQEDALAQLVDSL
jgi:predicted esterase